MKRLEKRSKTVATYRDLFISKVIYKFRFRNCAITVDIDFSELSLELVSHGVKDSCLLNLLIDGVWIGKTLSNIIGSVWYGRGCCRCGSGRDENVDICH